jgi:multicomponent Na+:H+ antiporter subunit D
MDNVRSLLVTLPILIPLATAIGTLMLWREKTRKRAISLFGTSSLFVLGVLLLIMLANSESHVFAIQMGGWDAPVGITLVADTFSAIMVTMTGLVSTAVMVYAIGNLNKDIEFFSFHPLFHILLMGVVGAFLTGDVFNMYVWFEVMLISSFVLIVIGERRKQYIGGIKYVTINLLSSAIFLAALASLYGLVGTLNMAHIHDLLYDPSTATGIAAPYARNLALTIAILLLVAFSIKAALVPFHFWLPASYHTPPVPVAAIFAGLLTKVGVYAIFRVYTLIFPLDIFPEIRTLLLVLASITILVGMAGAISTDHIRRVLSFNLVSHIGFMVLGVAFFTEFALAGAILYIIHHILVKTTLFLVSGMITNVQGTPSLRKMGGLYRQEPLLALLFFIPALSLSGIPPFSGFWPKLALIRAGLSNPATYVFVGVMLVGSVLTLYSMMKVWQFAFWRSTPEHEGETYHAPLKISKPMWASVIALVVLVMLLGLFANPILSIAQDAAAGLLHPEIYLQAILGGKG